MNQVIEKAYKKLRLDALVIQQGRLTESTKGVNKDDLLSMVRYGAEMVFNNTVRTVTAYGFRQFNDPRWVIMIMPLGRMP